MGRGRKKKVCEKVEEEMTGKKKVNEKVEEEKPEYGFKCREFGNFCTDYHKGGFFSITKEGKNVLGVGEIQDSEKGRVIIDVKPFKNTLKEFLSVSELSSRRVSRYGSYELYPSETIKPLIQGLVTAVLNLVRSGRKHGHLLNLENVVIHNEEFHPYAGFVKEAVFRNNYAKLKEFGHNQSATVKISLVHSNEDGEQEEDIHALWVLIFDRILEVDAKNHRLPTDWIHFNDLFAKKPADYALLSSHPCMWGSLKRIKMFGAVHDWFYATCKEVHDKVLGLLEDMAIFQEDWLLVADRDVVLKILKSKSSYKPDKVYSLITFFRNAEQHCHEIAGRFPDDSEEYKYSDKQYQEYRLSVLFPNLIVEVYSRLLVSGFVYPSY